MAMDVLSHFQRSLFRAPAIQPGKNVENSQWRSVKPSFLGHEKPFLTKLLRPRGGA
jgi:hypothetical protein